MLAIHTLEFQPDTSGGFLPAFRLGSRESTVSCGDAPEPPLPPLSLAGLLSLDLVDRVRGVLLAPRAVHVHFSWKFHLHHTSCSYAIIRHYKYILITMML